MKSIRLTLPLPPSVNAYWRSIVRGRHATVIVSKEGREFRKNAADAGFTQLAGVLNVFPEGPVGVSAIVYFPNRRGDLDNRLKPVLDALQGVAYSDDRQIVAINAVRQIDKDSPRVEVAVWAA